MRGPHGLAQLQRAVQIPRGDDDVLHLPAVRARVHRHPAAERAGDAVGKLHPAEAKLLRLAREARERDAALRAQRIRPGPLHGGHLLAKLHGDARKRRVRHEQVRAVAEDERRDRRSAKRAADCRRLLRRRRLHQRAHRPADAKRAVPVHRLVLQNRQRRKLLPQAAHRKFKLIHKRLPDKKFRMTSRGRSRGRVRPPAPARR